MTSAPGAGLDLPARLRRIELAVSHKVFGRRDGRHASLVLGHGVEPGEARPYEPGDDVRRMDWSILARTGEPHVRDAIQERDLDVAVLVDRSGSLDFGTVGWRKADLAVTVASAMSGLAVLGGDRIGAVVATAGGPRIVPIRGGRRHLTGLMGSVARSPLGGQVDLGRAIDGLRHVLRRRGLAIVVSDFIAPIDTWSPALARLGRRSEVIAVEVVDPRELRLPDVGLLVIEDPETGRQRTIDTGDERFRVRLAEVADRRSAARSSAIRRAGAMHLRLRTDDGLERSARSLPVPIPSRPSRGSAHGIASHHGCCAMIPFAPDLTFLAPERFALLLVPLLLAILYLVRQRRRHAYVVRFTDPDLIDTVAPRRPGLRRHVVAAVYLAATALLVIAAARPAMATEVANEPTVVLAFDTSISMEATDVAPSRIVAAREAAHRFIEVVPAGVRVGLVAFDGTARVVIPPTTSKTVLDRAIDRLSLGQGTAIGEAIYTSLDVLESDVLQSDAPADAQGAGGSIVLMSDGDTTVGRSEEDAAREAQRRGVKVSTVAFGTDHGSVVVDFVPVPVPVNREALRDIAETTGGKVFEADSAEEIVSVFEDIGEGVGTRTEPREITDGLALAALMTAALAAIGSLAWFARLP